MPPDLHNPISGPFWQAAQAGHLAMTWCEACERCVWYPQDGCPDCQQGLVWKTLSGRARLLSWTVVRKPVNPDFPVPYMPALVVPEEAPHARLVTWLVECEAWSLRCDMNLRVMFWKIETNAGERFVAPVFTPVNTPA